MTRAPILHASYTRPSACTCPWTQAYTARRAKRTRIALIRGSITGSPVGTTGTASPYAAAGDLSRIRAAIQASAPSSMAIWGSKAWQPRYAQCTDVVADSDNPRHRGRYSASSPAQGVYMAERPSSLRGRCTALPNRVRAGRTNVPVTPSVGQANGELSKAGSRFAATYPLTTVMGPEYSGAGSTMCNKPCDVPVNSPAQGLSLRPPVLPSPTLPQPPHLPGLVISTRKAAAATMVSFVGGNEIFWAAFARAPTDPPMAIYSASERN